MSFTPFGYTISPQNIALNTELSSLHKPVYDGKYPECPPPSESFPLILPAVKPTNDG